MNIFPRQENLPGEIFYDSFVSPFKSKYTRLVTISSIAWICAFAWSACSWCVTITHTSFSPSYFLRRSSGTLYHSSAYRILFCIITFLTFDLIPASATAHNAISRFALILNECPLIKSYDFLRDLIRRNRDPPSAPSRKVHCIAHNAVAQTVEQAQVRLFDIAP